MSKQSERKRKQRIRLRDRRRYQKDGRCFLCGLYITTELHHLRYPDQYDPRAIIELCQDCHDDVHGRKKTPKPRMPNQRVKEIVSYTNLTSFTNKSYYAPVWNMWVMS